MSTYSNYRNTATQGQVLLIQRLVAERKVPDTLLASFRQLWRSSGITPQVADSIIRLFQKYEPKARVSDNVALVGIHQIGRSRVLVRISKSGQLYGYVLRADGSRQYAPELARYASAATKID